MCFKVKTKQMAKGTKQMAKGTKDMAKGTKHMAGGTIGLVEQVSIIPEDK